MFPRNIIAVTIVCKAHIHFSTWKTRLIRFTQSRTFNNRCNKTIYLFLCTEFYNTCWQPPPFPLKDTALLELALPFSELNKSRNKETISKTTAWCVVWNEPDHSECGSAELLLSVWEEGLDRAAVTEGGIAHLLEGWSDLGEQSCWILCQARSLINSPSNLFISISATQKKHGVNNDHAYLYFIHYLQFTVC